MYADDTQIFASSYHANELIVKLNSVLIQVRKWFMKNSSFNSVYFSRPFPSSKNYHFQNEARCENFLVKMSYICMKIKNSIYINSYVRLSPRFESEAWSNSEIVCWPVRFVRCLSPERPRDSFYVISPHAWMYEDGRHREMGSIGEMLWLLKDLLIHRLTTLNYWIFAHFRSRSSTGATFRVQDDSFTSRRKLASTVGKRIQLWFPAPAW